MLKLGMCIKCIGIVFCLAITSVLGVEAPFTRGVNLTQWFEVAGPRQIQFSKFTRQDLVNIQSLGCDVVRLPINLHAMTAGPPEYTLDPLFLRFLDEVVDWAEELQLHLILDNHSFDPASSTDPNIVNVLMPVWTQMAAHFKGRSDYLYYEVLNEPHGIADALWNDIQQQVITAIRAVDPNHTIVVGPASWNGYNNLKLMPVYEDDNLIYTFHFYDPFLFTHQGASWTDPSMVPLRGIPFPYDANSMPDTPDELEGTWIASALKNYHNDGTVARVKQLIDVAADFQAQRNVPLLCGEFGVYMPNSDPEQRVNWYRLVREYLEEKGIAWTIWDYTGGFGLFEPGGNDLFEHDLNIPLVEALDFNTPPQTELIVEPDTAGFALYTDYIASGIVNSSWVGDATLDYYADADPVEGQYCLYWTGSDQYQQVGFNFIPN